MAIDRRHVLALAGASLPFACDYGASARKEAARQRLIGTWLRELNDGSTQLRRVVVLSADNSFREVAKVARPDGTVEMESHKGEWFFDGTNIKRKYTHLNDIPLSSSRMTFATFRLEPSSDDEIVGVDDIRQVKVTDRRVPDCTTP